MTYKMIVVDLDNTLLHTDKNVSDKTRAVFDEISKKVEICVATGRAIPRAEKYRDMIHANSLITLNGSVVYHHHKIVHSIPVDEENVLKLIAQLRQIKPIEIVARYPDEDMTTTKSFIERGVKELDLDHVQTHEIQSMFAISSNLKAVRNIDYDALGMKIMTNEENPASHIIMNRDAHKGNALQFLCEYLHIAPEEVVVFGDDYNDFEMMKFAGCSVAMANAVDEVKAIASQITDSNNEDGVANWILAHWNDFA